MPVGNVIDKNDSMCSFIVGSGDSFEPFLSGSIPDLQFNGASARIEGSDLEINTNGWKETKSREGLPFAEDIVGESEKEAGFAD